RDCPAGSPLQGECRRFESVSTHQSSQSRTRVPEAGRLGRERNAYRLRSRLQSLFPATRAGDRAAAVCRRQEHAGRGYQASDPNRERLEEVKTWQLQDGELQDGVRKKPSLAGTLLTTSNPKPIWWPTSRHVSRKPLMTRRCWQRRLVTSRAPAAWCSLRRTRAG